MRFVIHDHITENRHFDLMIETGDDLLLTWRIMPSDLDILLMSNEIQAVRIQDHEKYFLDYEGSLSTGNGSIVLFDQGNSKILKRRNNTLNVLLSGQVFIGSIQLTSIKDNTYNILYFPEYTK